MMLSQLNLQLAMNLLTELASVDYVLDNHIWSWSTMIEERLVEKVLEPTTPSLTNRELTNRRLLHVDSVWTRHISYRRPQEVGVYDSQ